MSGAAHGFKVSSVNTPDGMESILSSMNERGEVPVVVGIDLHMTPFLAYGWAPGGDGWDTGVVLDDPRSAEFEYDGHPPCGDCGAHPRLPLSMLAFPVAVMVES